MSTTSVVYGRVNPLEKACAGVVGKLDRNSRGVKAGRFCTFDPVDIHRVLHRRMSITQVAGADEHVRHGRGGYAELPHSTKFFFSRARQVYNQDLYTTLIVVVNGSQSLWTTWFTEEKSTIYLANKSVQFLANFLVANLNNIFASAKSRSSAQTIPVNIK
ncbi:hypothetical protein [Telluria beijingensis]|uniref:hypothetical protein n=1 Tax=Telluria beijingensis TaxID=3068633 RepID=UPI002795A106|nr:hypothetical protein [Massilia sp. REN29]